MRADIALAAALVAALGYGSASVLQALAARRATPGATLRHPWYVAGTGLDVLAWLVSLVALRTLPVYEVQAVLASSVAVTAILAHVTLGASLRRRDVAALAVAVAGLALLTASSAAPGPAPGGSAWRWVVAGAAVLVAVLGLLCARTASPSATAAVLAGTAYGGAAICAQQLPFPAHLWSWPSLTALTSNPLSYAFVGYALTGMWLYAVALERGEVGPATALLWISEVLAPSVAAAVLLHETFRSGWTLPGAVAVTAILAAALVLAAVEPATPARIEVTSGSDDAGP